MSRANAASRDPSAPASFRLRPDALAPKADRPGADEPSSTPQGERTGARPRDWNDAALRIKVTLLVLLAAVGGVGVGMIESHLRHVIWPLLIGLAVITLPLALLGVRWACRPIEDILGQLDRTQSPSRADIVGKLPLNREDEVGRLARIMHRFSIETTREQNDARQLRRTLDDSIDRATKLATRNLKELAMRDALTGLGNRRFLDDHLPELFLSCLQSNTDLVCVAIDIDNFKMLNDTLGHGAGDDLLSTLGQLIMGLIRHEDYAVRLGGDEFLILMPGCPLSRVRQLTDQLYGLFRQHLRVVVRSETKPDLSMGASSLRRDRITSPQELLKRADEYLYESKRGGKGRLTGA